MPGTSGDLLCLSLQVNNNDTVTAIVRPSLDTEVGELAIEIKLVEFLKTFRRPAHLGTNVGIHCTKVLNINTSVSSAISSAFLKKQRLNGHVDVFILLAGSAERVSAITTTCVQV